MMHVQEVDRFLQAKARELRPTSRHLPARVVQIASDLGIDVKLVLRRFSDYGKYSARCELYGRPPQILIYRNSTSAGIATLSPADEHVLSSRERFSVAHELAHCIAYQSCGLKPVSERDNRREYWGQERIMQEFASALLVPSWLCSRWKSQLSNFDATCVFRIHNWANECSTSPDVVATALTRDMQDIGFLRVGEGVRTQSGERIFVVFHSCSSNNLVLPNVYSHIRDDDLVKAVTGIGGVVRLSRCRLGFIELTEVQMAWCTARGKVESRRREFRNTVRLSGTFYWVCAFTGYRTSDKGQGAFEFEPREGRSTSGQQLGSVSARKGA